MPRTHVHPDEGVRLDQGSQPPPTGPQRSGWTWFWAAFSVVLLVGVSILYVAGRPDDEIATPIADAPEAQDPPAADDPQPADDPIPIAATQTSAVLLGSYVVDSFGFHAMEEDYAEATEVGERDAGNIGKVLAAVDAVDWPEDLTGPVATLRTDLTGLIAALDAGDLDGSRAGFAAVHSSQHDFSNGVYDWLATAPADGSTSAVLLGSYVVDSFGFHAMEQDYAEATEVGERDAGNIGKVLAAVDAVDWPEDLTGPVATLRTDLTGLIAALDAGDLDGSRAGFAAVHSSQHDFSNGVYDWLATATADGSTSAVLLGSYVVDSFGFHALEEDYADATEVGERDAGNIGKVLAAIDAVDWPEDLTGPVATLRTDLTGLIAALEAGDLDASRAGFAAVHSSQHDFSNGVYSRLRGEEPATSHADGEEPATTEVTGDASDAAGEVIEIEMVEFGYSPEAIEIEAGVPVILRFTNSGRLEHEAMVGDGHMQEDWASASDGHDPGDGHHGDLMAITLDPGETGDLAVVIDEPGTWYFACHLTGHYEQGQVATINVTG